LYKEKPVHIDIEFDLSSIGRRLDQQISNMDVQFIEMRDEDKFRT
jgi:hypothetical protein